MSRSQSPAAGFRYLGLACPRRDLEAKTGLCARSDVLARAQKPIGKDAAARPELTGQSSRAKTHGRALMSEHSAEPQRWARRRRLADRSAACTAGFGRRLCGAGRRRALERSDGTEARMLAGRVSRSGQPARAAGQGGRPGKPASQGGTLRGEWAEQDSNLRRHVPTDLQSVPFGRLGIRPENIRLGRAVQAQPASASPAGGRARGNRSRGSLPTRPDVDRVVRERPSAVALGAAGRPRAACG